MLQLGSGSNAVAHRTADFGRTGQQVCCRYMSTLPVDDQHTPAANFE